MGLGSMEDMISGVIKDDSGRESGILRFAVRCDSCGEIWRSEPRRFSMAGVTAENENKQVIYDAMWEREWQSARSLAVAEAAKYFSLCPICKRISCDICFHVCDTLDMCASCAKRLEEPCAPLADCALPPTV